MTCPQCGASLGAPIVQALVICRSCLRSVVVDGDDVRLARAADTVSLTDPELATLRQARAAARKAL